MNAADPCPALKQDDGVQKEVVASRARDEARIAALAAQGLRPVRTVYADGGQHPDMAQHARYASRPEALLQGPVEVAVEESKQKKAKVAAAAKLGAAKKELPKAAANAAGPSAKPAEPLTVAATAPEPAKPQEGSFFSRWFGAKPAETKSEPVVETPAIPPPAALPAAGPVPQPQKGHEASSAPPKGKPQNSVAAPAPAKPQAAVQPSAAASKAVAMLRGGILAPSQPH